MITFFEVPKLRGWEVKKEEEKMFAKSVHKMCPQKLSTKGVHKKCLHNVSTKRVHKKCPQKCPQKSVQKECQKIVFQKVSLKSVHKNVHKSVLQNSSSFSKHRPSGPMICPYVCLSVCALFEVPFKRLLVPTSRSRMSKMFRDSESLGGKKNHQRVMEDPIFLIV